MSSAVWASRLRERITVEQPVTITDELGGQSTTWATLAQLWAEIVPLTGASRERAQSAQAQANAGYRVRIRARDDINASMRLQWKTHTLSIHSLHEQDDILEILVYEEAL